MTRNVIAVPERAVRLRVNGLVIATWTCTPADLEALAAGRLVSDGFIHDADDVLALRTLPDDGRTLGVDAEVPPERMAAAVAEGDHRAEHGCGPRFLVDCRPELIRREGGGSEPDPDVFHGLFRELFAGAETYRATGGLHTAALSDGASLVHLHEEVSRHNAVDKAIGAALLEGLDLQTFGLVTTARVSGRIAAQTARAGLAWIASRSVPTTLAVEIAAVAGLLIVARAPSPEARVFAPGAGAA